MFFGGRRKPWSDPGFGFISWRGEAGGKRASVSTRRGGTSAGIWQPRHTFLRFVSENCGLAPVEAVSG
jgi:hypothetical protein